MILIEQKIWHLWCNNQIIGQTTGQHMITHNIASKSFYGLLFAQYKLKLQISKISVYILFFSDVILIYLQEQATTNRQRYSFHQSHQIKETEALCKSQNDMPEEGVAHYLLVSASIEQRLGYQSISQQKQIQCRKFIHDAGCSNKRTVIKGRQIKARTVNKMAKMFVNTYKVLVVRNRPIRLR